MSPAADELRAASEAVRELLVRVPDLSVPVPRVGLDVRGVVQHMAGCLIWYAHDLVAGPAESPGPEARWPVDLRAEQMAREVGVAAEVLARVAGSARPGERGWHPWGLSDATGFAAIGAAELVLHGDDVATALALDWRPPEGVVQTILGRLFPGVQSGCGAWRTLLWATGREDLPDRERVTGWRYAMAVPG